MTATDLTPARAQRGRVVVDTSAWIEYFVDSALGQRIKPSLPPLEECIVPTIVQHELEKWALRALSDVQHEHVDRTLGNCPVDMLDTSTAKRAAQVHRRHKLATADALIYATALKFHAEVVTCDAHFKELPSVQYHPKGESQGGDVSSRGAAGQWNGWPTSDQMSARMQ